MLLTPNVAYKVCLVFSTEHAGIDLQIALALMAVYVLHGEASHRGLVPGTRTTFKKVRSIPTPSRYRLQYLLVFGARGLRAGGRFLTVAMARDSHNYERPTRGLPQSTRSPTLSHYAA